MNSSPRILRLLAVAGVAVLFLLGGSAWAAHHEATDEDAQGETVAEGFLIDNIPKSKSLKF